MNHSFPFSIPKQFNAPACRVATEQFTTVEIKIPAMQLQATGHHGLLNKRKRHELAVGNPRLSVAFRYSQPLNYGDVFVDFPWDSRSILRSTSYC